MTQVADRPIGTDAYVAAFARARQEGSGAPAWLAAVRDAAIARFGALGFPTLRHEEWRFTSVAPIAEHQFQIASGGAANVTETDLAPALFGTSGASRQVFVNGRHVAALSVAGRWPEGVEVTDLAGMLDVESAKLEAHLTRLAGFGDRPFVALNTALFGDGALVRVPEGVVVEEPIHLLFVSTATDGATVSHPRVLVVTGANSQIRLVESYTGRGAGTVFTNAVTEVVVGENAVVDHYKVQRESVGGYHIGSMHVRLARNATFSSHSIALGAALARNDVEAVLDGEGGECTLNGLYLVDDRRLVDNHTTIDHAKPHCDSHEVYKGILSGHARGVFNGKIIVRPDAQKTDAKQTNRALLLSDDAQINTKPQLEIFADDVKCTHGAAVGQLDDDAVFYLRSRGLGVEQARMLLIQAFAGDILGRIRIEPLRGQLEAEMLRQLPGGAAR
jgi:Fe-S cluster assembly protein SufD